jgi:endonuclease/exonuclease/phosphatase family metal-dependent hydrolase
MENLFDLIDDPDKNDSEWLEGEAKDWSEERLALKMENIAKVIQYMNDGKGPDLLGFQEVEHRHLIDTLISRHLHNNNYSVVYFESPDKRGIDNGIIFNNRMFDLEHVRAHTVVLQDHYPTRDIVEAAFKINDVKIYLFVNHWPSRRGGQEKSEPNRLSAAETLNTALQEVYESNDEPNVIILGDFNDEPDNKSITEVLGAVKYDCLLESGVSESLLYNLSYKSFENGQGSYLYRGDWNMLDQIIISNSLTDKSNFYYDCASFKVIRPEIMITGEGRYKGAAIPTYGGRKYLGGFSDHYPVGAGFKYFSE